MKVAIENLVIAGESDGGMVTVVKGEEGIRPPFAIFSLDLQANVGGPYASYEHAEAALDLMKQGRMAPYAYRSAVEPQKSRDAIEKEKTALRAENDAMMETILRNMEAVNVRFKGGAISTARDDELLRTCLELWKSVFARIVNKPR